MNRNEETLWLWDLAQRFKALKEKGTRAFELWRRLQESRAAHKASEHEVWATKGELTRARLNLEMANKALAVSARMDPLAEAEVLLAAASEIMKQPTMQVYEFRSWLGEYQAYQFRRYRANYQS